MTKAISYRYFFGFRPPPAIGRWIMTQVWAIGIEIGANALEKSHVTLCTVAELPLPDPLMAKRADKFLAKAGLLTCRVNLGRLEAGPNGVMLRSIGSQAEIQGFYQRLTALIEGCGLLPMHRKSGLKPHITLSYGHFSQRKVRLPVGWFPDELLLIESHVSQSRHVIIGRWPLMPPVQGELGLCA